MGDKIDKFLHTNVEPDVNLFSSLRGADAAGLGGLISSIGKQALASYEPRSNKWDLRPRILIKGLYDGFFGSYLAKATESSLSMEDPIYWDFANTPGWIDWITEKWPSIASARVSASSSILFRLVFHF